MSTQDFVWPDYCDFLVRSCRKRTVSEAHEAFEELKDLARMSRCPVVLARTLDRRSGDYEKRLVLIKARKDAGVPITFESTPTEFVVYGEDSDSGS
jgi:hypothetical protein